MYINFHIILFVIAAFTISGLVIALLRTRRPQIRHQMPFENDMPPMSLKENSIYPNDEIIAVRSVTTEQKKVKPRVSFTGDDNRLIKSLGLSDIDPIFSDPIEPVKVEAQPVQAVQTQTSSAKSKTQQDLIVINLLAQPNQQFQGYELLQSLLSVGLRFGKMSIFHRHQHPNGQGPILFSLASATEPGIFDMNKMGVFSCTGLCLFMRLQGPEHNIAAFDLLLETANQLAEDLEGTLRDTSRRELSAETVSYFRELVNTHEQRLGQ